ncbi:UNVERIFIED_ORG: hypothetical protein ABIB19_003587 [Arthrobacter sp. UYEF10]
MKAALGGGLGDRRGSGGIALPGDILIIVPAGPGLLRGLTACLLRCLGLDGFPGGLHRLGAADPVGQFGRQFIAAFARPVTGVLGAASTVFASSIRSLISSARTFCFSTVPARDAAARGWSSEAQRHQRLVEQLDILISEAHTG